MGFLTRAIARYSVHDLTDDTNTLHTYTGDYFSYNKKEIIDDVSRTIELRVREVYPEYELKILDVRIIKNY